MNSDALCGTSDSRNNEYEKKFNIKSLYSQIFTEDDIPLIFDIGAHKGESIRHFSEIFKNSVIHSFEPDPQSFSHLTSSFSNHPSIAKLNNLALSNSCGCKTFYKQKLSHLGSLSKINTSSKDSLGFAERALNEAINVNVTTIDEYCNRNNIKNIDILKIDVQGHEYDVLLGSKLSLKTIKCLAIEICLFDFYEKVSDISNIFNLLYEENFSLYSIPKISQNPSNFRSDWFEAIFVK